MKIIVRASVISGARAINDATNASAKISTGFVGYLNETVNSEDIPLSLLTARIR